MDINIRSAVISNLQNSSSDSIRSTIEDAMSIGEEKVLPGLGVMFEVLWKKASPDLKKTIVSHITESLK